MSTTDKADVEFEEYGLTRLVLEEEHFVEISAEYYGCALDARRKLHLVLAAEEKITMVLENYVELETELLGAIQRQLVFDLDGWSEFMSELNTFNRRLMNFLTVSRMYLDQIQHDVHSLYGKHSAQAESITREKSKQYDALLGYRVMEALRNYVQHRGLPISKLQHWGSWNVDPGRRTTINVVTPSLKVQQLREDGNFKKSVLTELEQLGDSLDIKPLTREYMEGIGGVHQHFRDLVSADVNSWDSTITDAIERYQAVGGEKVIGLALAVRRSGRVAQSHTISQNPVERRKWLQRRTRHLTHYPKHTASSAVREHLTSAPKNTLHD